MRFIKGVQGLDPSGDDKGFAFIRAASTPKHYASYNLDNWHGMDRYHYNSLVTKQDWADTYSQPFWAAVVGANASGLMCSCERSAHSSPPPPLPLHFHFPRAARATGAWTHGRCPQTTQ
eukprot:SAG11_NODE_4015_length_2106_cov_3.022422_2_plen_119_part_00